MSDESRGIRPGAKAAYHDDVECPVIGVRLVSGGYRYHEAELHDWRCLHTPDGFVWYCTRCRKISTMQPRKPKRRKS